MPEQGQNEDNGQGDPQKPQKQSTTEIHTHLPKLRDVLLEDDQDEIESCKKLIRTIGRKVPDFYGLLVRLDVAP